MSGDKDNEWYVVNSLTRGTVVIKGLDELTRYGASFDLTGDDKAVMRKSFMETGGVGCTPAGPDCRYGVYVGPMLIFAVSPPLGL